MGGMEMTEKEIQKRSQKSEALRVLQADGSFFVESQQGQVLYRVHHDGEGRYSCSCGDHAHGIKQDQNFQCKHVLAVLNSVVAGDAEGAEFLEKRKPKLDDRFVIEIDGREFVRFAGLLDLGHQKGLLKIEVEPLQFPSKENDNMAICQATVLSKSGETFVDVADANVLNTNSKVSKHLLRMASTRAIARALRTFTNIGMTCLEELGDDLDEVIRDNASQQGKSRKPISKKMNKPTEPPPPQNSKGEKGNGSNGDNGSNAKNKESSPKPEDPKPTLKPDSKPATKVESKPESVPKMSQAQKSAIFNLSRRRGITVEDLEKMSKQNYGVPLENLSSANASTFIRTLQTSA
jgi:hypothetical protein